MKSEVAQQIIKTLAEWEIDKSSLPPLLKLYRQLLGIQSEARAKIKPSVAKLTPAEVKVRLIGGRPLLEFASLPIDWGHFQTVFKAVSAVLAGYLELKTGLPESLSEIKNLKSMAEDWFQGEPLDTDWENPQVLGLIIQTALKPFLNVAGETLITSIDQEQWLRHYCPVCGGSPDFSFLDKERGARYLVCTRCDTEWLFKRMECPYCGNQDQEKLAYFTSDGGLYRLYVCEKCKNYLKAVDLRSTDRPVLIPLECLMTLDLDEQACGKGYSIHNHSRGFTNQKSVAIEG